MALSLLIVVILPSTIKRVHEFCFYQVQIPEIILNEGLESIGSYAFYDCPSISKSIVIPSTVTNIGEYAFNKSSIQYVDFRTTQLQEIPDYCFSFSDVKYVQFPENCQITRIGDSAFAGTLLNSFDFPDSVKTIGHSAFSKNENLVIDQLPQQLKEIGSYAFWETTFALKEIPESVEFIDSNALIAHHRYNYIEIPETVEYIGESAFGSITVKCNNEIDLSVAAVNEPGAYLNEQMWSTIEFPASLKTINQPFSNKYRKSKNLNVIWNEGIDEIVMSPYDEYCEFNMHLRKVGDLGDYTITGHIFNENEVFNYIEIPVNYLKNTKNKLSEPFMKDVILVGDTKSLKTYVELLKGALLENGRIIHRDDTGNETLLYMNQPQTYTKFSLFKSEIQNNYKIGTLSMQGETLSSSILEMDIQLTVGDSKLNSDIKVVLNGWQEEAGLSDADRAAQLKDYVYFEDLYLRQNFYKYFSINLVENDTIKNQKGSYLVTLKLEEPSLYENGIALYQIFGQRIERIPVSWQKHGDEVTIQFKTDRLGQFALIKKEVDQQIVDVPYLDSLYQLIRESHQTLTEDDVVFYEMTEGSQYFISKDDKYHVVVSKPELTDKQKDILLEETKLDDSWVFTDKERPDQDEETQSNLAEEALKKWELVEESFVVIDNETKHTKLQVSLPDSEEKEIQIHLMKVNKNDAVDVSKGNVKKLKEKKASRLIHGLHQAYYEIELDEPGQYYFFTTYEIVKTEEKGDLPVWFFVAAVLFVAVILKKLVRR